MSFGLVARASPPKRSCRSASATAAPVSPLSDGLMSELMPAIHCRLLLILHIRAHALKSWLESALLFGGFTILN
jgi:hypothetical protein